MKRSRFSEAQIIGICKEQERTHQGKMCCGANPAHDYDGGQTNLEGKVHKLNLN